MEEPIEEAGLYYRVPYLVMPRVLATNMPYEWQEKYVDLMREFQEAWDWGQIVGEYTVLPKKGGQFTKDELRDYRHFPMQRVEAIRAPQSVVKEKEVGETT